MKRLFWLLPVSLVVSCPAQTFCNPGALSQAAAKVLALQKELGQIEVDEMDEAVPPSVSGKITHLKDALSLASDAALSCPEPSIDPIELQKHLAQVLHANAPELPANTVISKDDHRYDEILGSYGHNLRVQVSRPPGLTGVLAIQYSTNIECGAHSMLLVYELRDNAWMQKLRWQSPPLKVISDAFGDFFVSVVLHDSSPLESKDTKWRVVVAHGTPWCTSRFSNFKIDLLSPGRNPASPQVLWHTERDYSRGDFAPRIKSSGNTFELRVNADCMSFDPENCFERRAIYRYSVDSNDHVRRVGPLAINARGFVAEWLTAPWSESQDLSAAESATALQKVHDQFAVPSKPTNEYLGHSYGPVRACAAPRTFQVQIDSTLEKNMPGNTGAESEPLVSYYFHVREVNDGYLMLSAPTEPDPTCSGANLMPAGNE
jgi:hypothetical protein